MITHFETITTEELGMQVQIKKLTTTHLPKVTYFKGHIGILKPHSTLKPVPHSRRAAPISNKGYTQPITKLKL
jgi:hypothetical protein